METLITASTHLVGCDKEDLPVLSPEKMIFSPRIVEVGRSSNGPRETDKVALTIRDFNVDTKQDTVNIFLHDVDSLSVKQLTRNAFGTKSLHPVVAAMHRGGTAELDHVLFLKQGKIYALPLDGGESYVVYEEDISINSFKCFCDHNNNTFLLCEMDVYPSMNPAQTAQYDVDQVSGKNLKTSAITYDQLMVRYWDNWSVFKKRNHIFSIAVEVDGNGRFAANKEFLRDLMFGMETDCPGKSPGNGCDDYSISPDGRYLAISCRKVFDSTKQPNDFAWTTDTPIFLGELRPEYLLGKNLNSVAIPWHQVSNADMHAGNSYPTFSHDSRFLAFLSMQRAGFESDRYRISVFDTESHSLHVLTENIDVSFQSILWSLENGENILYSTGQYFGTIRLFRIKLDSDCSRLLEISVMQGDESRIDPVVVSNYLYFQQSSLLSPYELKRIELKSYIIGQIFTTFSVDYYGAHARNHSDVVVLDRPDCISDIYCAFPGFTNGDFLMPSLNQHSFKGAKGEYVHGWYVGPVVLQQDDDNQYNGLQSENLPEKSIPLLIIIHGGPQSAILNAWNYRWNLAAFASQGYGVFAINFHGSTGYGESFTDSIRNDWGGKPFEDIMIGVDFILSQYKYLDRNRVAALGASYGGYMINWINGHSDRFRCLVNHDGVFSLVSQYYTTEELWFPGKLIVYPCCLFMMNSFLEWEFGLPWEKPDDYRRWSPESHVANWKTPTLVIHGGKDMRVPETEGIATFTSLQRRNIPSKLLYFPDECHWVLKPINSAYWYNTIFSWLKQWLHCKGN